MTFPGSGVPRFDSVTVSAPHNTLVSRNLGLHCGDGLELRDVCSFPDHVVNVERGRVGVVSAVNAPALDFEVSDPFFDAASIHADGGEPNGAIKPMFLIPATNEREQA